MEYPALMQLNGSIQHIILEDEDDLIKLCNSNLAFDKQSLCDICAMYGYPITVIQEMQYTDKVYRDAYYVYLSHLHFDIPRHCLRLSLFRGAIQLIHFFDSDNYASLQSALLGTIVIRPAYNHGNTYTIGRTLLNPAKMLRPLKYLRTARYKAVICGHKYIIHAFPFSNQHGDILRCAETSVWALMEYFGTRYETYRTVLPSTILSWESAEMAQRSLPSDGMTYSQISGLLKTFGFEPLIYVREIYKPEEAGPDHPLASAGSANIPARSDEASADECGEESIEYQAEQSARAIDQEIFARYQQARVVTGAQAREPSLQNLFHYYIEAGIPLITAVCNERESINHSIVVIGHDERSPHRMSSSQIRGNGFEIGALRYLDSADLYERYITIDDNQCPYRSERFDRFTISQNCKVQAFIVPLYRHILLSAEAAIKIIEAYLEDFAPDMEATLELLKEVKPGSLENSLDNPIVLRYYLTTSRGFVDFRNGSTEFLEEKLFYDATLFPKFVWVGEFSSLELYKQGKIFGEIVVDATAPRYSGSGAVISVRMGGRAASRKTDEGPGVLREKLINTDELQCSFIYDQYTNNLQKGDF